MGRTLLEILDHTPVSALGINFGFEESTENFEKLDIFSFGDTTDWIDRSYTQETAEIKRRFKLGNDEKGILNFSLILNQRKVALDFNFHYDCADTEKAKEIILEGIIAKNRDIALNILEDVYSLTLEEEDEE